MKWVDLVVETSKFELKKDTRKKEMDIIQTDINCECLSLKNLSHCFILIS